MKTKVTTLRRTATLAGVASLLLFAAASVHAASVPTLPDTATTATPQGQYLLVLTLALLTALVLMERLCSWQLGVLQRRAAPAPSLREALPSAPILLSAPLAADFR